MYKKKIFLIDENHLLVPSDNQEITVQQDSVVVIPCKPTFPDVQVELRALDNSKVSVPIIFGVTLRHVTKNEL